MSNELEDSRDNYIYQEYVWTLMHRYTAPRIYRSVNYDALTEDYFQLSDRQFKQQFRLEREYFNGIVSRIYPVMPKSKGTKPCAPVQVQFLVFLLRMGGKSYYDINKGLIFTKLVGISIGSVIQYVKNIIGAILTFKNRTITWPTEEQKMHTANEVEDKTGIPHCIGFIDGTVFPLASKPIEVGAQYWTRKGNLHFR
jgi:hypothetical protein